MSSRNLWDICIPPSAQTGPDEYIRRQYKRLTAAVYITWFYLLLSIRSVKTHVLYSEYIQSVFARVWTNGAWMALGYHPLLWNGALRSFPTVFCALVSLLSLVRVGLMSIIHLINDSWATWGCLCSLSYPCAKCWSGDYQVSWDLSIRHCALCCVHNVNTVQVKCIDVNWCKMRCVVIWACIVWLVRHMLWGYLGIGYVVI